MQLTARFNNATQFAVERHARHVRKGTIISYLALRGRCAMSTHRLPD